MTNCIGCKHLFFDTSPGDCLMGCVSFDGGESFDITPHRDHPGYVGYRCDLGLPGSDHRCYRYDVGDIPVVFRGYNNDRGWIYGSLVTKGSLCAIYLENTGECVEVFPESVGQFAGMIDVTGTSIYEGDIVMNESKVKCAVHRGIVNFDGNHYKCVGWKMDPIDEKDRDINCNGCQGYIVVGREFNLNDQRIHQEE